MIRFTSMSSEHKEVPNKCLISSEMTQRNRRGYESRDDKWNPYDEYSFNIYCTYAWIETDEIDSEEFAIAVMDYKPSYSKRTEFVFSEPIWNWIAEERTEEQQTFIDKNFSKLNELFIDFAQKNGYLKEVK